jgi:hypothetical protein
LINCVPSRIAEESFFLPLVNCNETVDIKGVIILSTFCLTQDVVLEYGIGDAEMERLYAFDKKAKRVIYESDPVVSPYGWLLYQFRTDSHVIIVWEIETEYCSSLDCFVLDIYKELFAYVGEFEVALPHHENLEDDNSYPVNQITIMPSDTIVTFRFPRRLLLRPGEEDQQEVDSLIYELNLHTNVMSHTSWPCDTLR